ncbi:MAG: DUF1080 domain-containing protein [Planctomycetia bacterium]|nr:DUF1080 domain-containing protein [Planctomycetia bacterium]
MKRYRFVLLVLLCLCSSPLFAKESDGMVPLFGEKLENAQMAADSWKFNDAGELYPAHKDVQIWTKEKFGSFVCKLEFKMSAGANSGFLFHCSDCDNWIPNAIEIQLLDDAGKAPQFRSSMSFYGYQAASKNVLKPAGQWNQLEVCSLGRQVRIKLNGEIVNQIDFSQWTDNAKSPAGTEIAKKFQHRNLAGMEPYGYIGIQGMHVKDIPITFRNLYVKRLDFSEHKATESLFGQKLEKADYDPKIWSIDDEGILRATKDDVIWSRDKYKNFVLDLEFQTVAKANSGIVIKCDDKKKWIPNSLEVQIYDSFGEPNDFRACGSIFGRCPTLFNTCKKSGEWNKMRVVCQGDLITVVLNGEIVTMMDKSKFKHKVKNPDGTEAYPWLRERAPANISNEGYIGIQGLHGKQPVIYRNICIRKL